MRFADLRAADVISPHRPAGQDDQRGAREAPCDGPTVVPRVSSRGRPRR
jgi:hypothetical protein